jgi:hypothetical protein
VAGTEGAIVVRQETRLTVVAWDAATRGQVLASLAAAVGSVEAVADTRVTLGALFEEVDLLRPDLTRKEAQGGSRRRVWRHALVQALADVGTEVNPGDLARVHVPLPGERRS